MTYSKAGDYDVTLTVTDGVGQTDGDTTTVTITPGELPVAGVPGQFRIANVNGSISLNSLRATGHATTVNGRLDATFERTPAGETSFETVNGDIEVRFPPDLSADLEFKTGRGEVWTDFQFEPLPLNTVREQMRDGELYVIRVDRSSRVRVASGGPTFSFETLNGDVSIREAQQ